MGGIFSLDFIKQFGIPEALAMAAPEAGTLAKTLEKVERVVARKRLEPFNLGLALTASNERGLMVGAEAFEKWGPIFGLLKKRYWNKLHIAIVTQGDAEERAVYRQAIEKLNREFELASPLLAYDNVVQAQFALLRKGLSEAQIQKIGFGSVPLTPPVELSQDFLFLPAVQALLAQFSHELRALESAA